VGALAGSKRGEHLVEQPPPESQLNLIWMGLGSSNMYVRKQLFDATDSVGDKRLLVASKGQDDAALGRGPFCSEVAEELSE